MGMKSTKKSNWFNEPQKTFCKQLYDVIRFRTSFSLCLRVGIGPKPWDSPIFQTDQFIGGPPNSPPNTHWPGIIFHSNTAPWWGLSRSWMPNLYSKSKFEQKFRIAMLIYVGLAKGTPKTELNRCGNSHPNSRETPHPNQHGASPRGPKEICKNPSEQGGCWLKKIQGKLCRLSSIFPEKSFEPQITPKEPKFPSMRAIFPCPKGCHRMVSGLDELTAGKHMMYMVNHSKSLYKSIYIYIYIIL